MYQHRGGGKGPHEDQGDEVSHRDWDVFGAIEDIIALQDTDNRPPRHPPLQGAAEVAPPAPPPSARPSPPKDLTAAPQDCQRERACKSGGEEDHDEDGGGSTRAMSFQEH